MCVCVCVRACVRMCACVCLHMYKDMLTLMPTEVLEQTLLIPYDEAFQNHVHIKNRKSYSLHAPQLRLVLNET